MIILDTNVLSAIMRPLPDALVIRWLNSQPTSALWTSSVTIFEIEFGLETMPAGKRRAGMTSAYREWLKAIIQDRIANLDTAAAASAASLAAERQKRGRPGELRDTLIAGIVRANCATLATRNVKHFDDIAARIVNPWDA